MSDSSNDHFLKTFFGKFLLKKKLTVLGILEILFNLRCFKKIRTKNAKLLPTNSQLHTFTALTVDNIYLMSRCALHFIRSKTLSSQSNERKKA
jgi:hypothetical protein